MEQDHYKTLGLNRSATKDEIKTAYRKSALEFHPDKHAQASAAIRDSAAARFRKASEAYETLIDETRRSDYDSRLRSGFTSRSSTSSGSYGSSSGSSGTRNYNYNRTGSWSSSSSTGPGGTTYTWTWTSSSSSSSGAGGNGGRGTSWGYYEAAGRSDVTGWQFLSRVMTTRRFLIGVGCLSILVGSALYIEDAIQRAWRRNNSGKSFEEAMEALEKARVQKDGDS